VLFKLAQPALKPLLYSEGKPERLMEFATCEGLAAPGREDWEAQPVSTRQSDNNSAVPAAAIRSFAMTACSR